MSNATRAAALAALSLTIACGGGESAVANTGGDAVRGRAVYKTTCGACHNADPRLPGAVGPEVAGASRELLEARVLHATYPPGYTPKRDTKLMAALPQMAPEIDHLHAYLSSVK